MGSDSFDDQHDAMIPIWFEIAAGAIAVMVVVFFAAMIITGVKRYRTTKRFALEAGLSVADAATFAATSPEGLETAFLARQLNPRTAQPSAEARLAELQALRDKGLITPEEYDAKRRAILDAL